VRFKERMSVPFSCASASSSYSHAVWLAGCVLDFCLVNCLRIIINSFACALFGPGFYVLFAFFG